jgi:hypothetical protein
MSKAFLLLYYMENKEIKLHVQLTEKDYLKFQLDHVGFLKSKKWWAYVGIIILVLLFINVPDIITHGFSSVSFVSFIPLLVFGGIVTASLFSIKARVKTSFASDPSINNPMEIIITNDGMTINAYKTIVNPSWEDIYRYLIVKDTIYIYTSELKSIIIPKRFFENENDINTLTELLKNKVDLSTYKEQKNNRKYLRWIGPVIIILCVFLYTFVIGSGDSEKQNQAWAFEKKSDYKSASEIYTQLIKDNPENGIYYSYRAKCKIELEDYKSAILDCEKAINLDSKDGLAFYMYAFALYDDGRYNDACNAIHKSIEIGYTQEDEGFCDPPEN